VADRTVEPLRIGLTGSIGMGKSETAKMFARLGIPVYDADAAIQSLYAKGGAAVAPIAAAFPAAVTDGAVDRKVLSGIVTRDANAFRWLEEIVHPLVRERREKFLARATLEMQPLVLLDIPLLFESGSEKDVDVVVVASAPAEMQRERVLSRPGMTQEKFAAILARQIPDAEKRAKADFVVDTSKGLEHAAAEVDAIVAALTAGAKRKE